MWIFWKKDEEVEENIIEDDNINIEETTENTEDITEDTENINTDAEEVSLDDDVDSDIESGEEVEIECKFVLDEDTKEPFIYKWKKVLKKYKEWKFTVIETEDWANYKNIS